MRTTLPLPALKLRPYAAFDFAHEGRERWHGVDGSESYTRNDLLGGAGVEWEFAPDWQVEGGLRVRIAKLSNGVSLDYPGILILGIATHFDFARQR